MLTKYQRSRAIETVVAQRQYTQWLCNLPTLSLGRPLRAGSEGP